MTKRKVARTELLTKGVLVPFTPSEQHAYMEGYEAGQRAMKNRVRKVVGDFISNPADSFEDMTDALFRLKIEKPK